VALRCGTTEYLEPAFVPQSRDHGLERYLHVGRQDQGAVKRDVLQFHGAGWIGAPGCSERELEIAGSGKHRLVEHAVVFQEIRCIRANATGKPPLVGAGEPHFFPEQGMEHMMHGWRNQRRVLSGRFRNPVLPTIERVGRQDDAPCRSIAPERTPVDVCSAHVQLGHGLQQLLMRRLGSCDSPQAVRGRA
jgi:hypothetical protein